MKKTLRSRLWTVAKALLFTVLALVMLILSGWGVLMLHYSNLPWGWLRNAAAVLFAVFALVAIVSALWSRKRRWIAIGAFAVLWVGMLVWFRMIPPSDTRDWQPDVAKTAKVTIDGDLVTIENVRNFVYRSETDYDEHWETRTYDLSKLDGHDLMFVYWGSPAIAHTMISFRFRDESTPSGYSFLPISIEVRKEKSESYSTIAGFFRQFELYYIFADERDVVGLRTNHRGEQVYLYRTLAPAVRSKKILLDYLKSADELSKNAKWYNTLTDNCTNGIVYHIRALGEPIPLTYELILSGYSDHYVYVGGGFGHSLPFDELKQRSLVNDVAQGHDRDPKFSSIIREKLPGYAPKGD